MKKNRFFLTVFIVFSFYFSNFTTSMIFAEIIKGDKTVISLGHANGGVAFQKGSVLTRYPSGQVKSGTLAVERTLNVNPKGNSAVSFQEGTEVTFNQEGYVTAGTLAVERKLNVPPNKNGAATFQRGTRIFFNNSGYVVSGTLAVETTLNTNTGTSRSFKRGSVIRLDEQGAAITGAATEEKKASKAFSGDVVNETHWTVNNHPVPWVFHADGRVDAKGLWQGTWKQVSGGYTVTIVHQGVSDSFLIKFSDDGKSFTAYKNNSVYRSGVRLAGPAKPSKSTVTVTLRNASQENVHIVQKGNSYDPANRLTPGQSRQVSVMLPSDGFLEFCAGRGGQTIACCGRSVTADDKDKGFTVTFDDKTLPPLTSLRK
jgi:hypothetical protein